MTTFDVEAPTEGFVKDATEHVTRGAEDCAQTIAPTAEIVTVLELKVAEKTE
jgi:hypothetical protein